MHETLRNSTGGLILLPFVMLVPTGVFLAIWSQHDDLDAFGSPVAVLLTFTQVCMALLLVLMAFVWVRTLGAAVQEQPIASAGPAGIALGPAAEGRGRASHRGRTSPSSVTTRWPGSTRWARTPAPCTPTTCRSSWPTPGREGPPRRPAPGLGGLLGRRRRLRPGGRAGLRRTLPLGADPYRQRLNQGL